MNLTKLFETQKVLRDRIGYNEPDRFNKLVLALLVELGECANEWRGFKFWSKDQEPRTKVIGDPYDDMLGNTWHRNPLLEEYVDGLHFVLELGLEIEFKSDDWMSQAYYYHGHDITTHFIKLYQKITDFQDDPTESDYVNLIEMYLGLGEMLGFTGEQIEQAYIDKNKVNHERQNNGY